MVGRPGQTRHPPLELFGSGGTFAAPVVPSLRRGCPLDQCHPDLRLLTHRGGEADLQDQA